MTFLKMMMVQGSLALGGLCLLHGQAAVEPRAPNWTPTSILTWSSATDADAPYNRSLVPLATRFAPPTVAENAALNAALNLNPHARTKEGRVMPLVAFDGCPSQGARTARYYAPTSWQYIDNMTYWGSSRPGTRYIAAPPAHVIDAAHRNGVPIMGNVFFVWNGSTDNATLQGVRDLLQYTGTAPNKVFPVAAKMIEAATYFNFDGWFINQENYQTNATDAQNMRDFIVYYRANAPANQKIIWYDAMAENGSRSFQNALTTTNDGYMKEGTTLRAHTMFMNFWWWNSNNLANSRTLAQSLGLDPYDFYAGIDTESRGDSGYVPDPNQANNVTLDWERVFPEGQAHRVSLGIYRPEWTFNYASNSDPSDAIKREIRYWCGPASDPAITVNHAAYPTASWPGIAHYIPANSPVMAKPFVTHFNLGQGTQAAVNGTISTSGPWTNLSTQDVLPTWKWNVVSTGTKLVPAFDFSDPYYGGTSLKITGDLNATNDIKLYQTSLSVAANTNLQLIYKRGATGATAMQVGLAFEDAPATFVYLDVGTSASTGWNTTNFPLATYAGKKIVLISLRFTNASTITGYSMKLGRLAVFDGAAVVPTAPSNVLVEAMNSVDVDTVSLRLKWTVSPDALRQYNVYIRHANNTLTWAGACLNNVYFLPAGRRINSETTYKIEIEAVSPTFGASTHAVSADVTLPAAPPLTAPFITSYSPFTGATNIGTSGTWGGTATRDKTYDNSTSTTFDSTDADANTAWSGLDLGDGNGREVRAISYYPRSGWSSRMVGGRFEGSNVADFSSGVTLLATVDVTPQEGIYTTIAINNPTVFRYVRYLTPGGGHCNVGEVKFYGPPNFAGTTMTWDSGNTGNGATINPAAGLWNTLAQNIPWNGGASNYPWVNGIEANFGGSDGAAGAYPITVAADGITATNLNFTNSGYTLSATSARNLNLTGKILVATGKNGTIGNSLAVLYTASTVFTIGGPGTLNIAAGATVAKTGTNNLQVSGNGTVVNVAGTLSRTGNGVGSNSIRIGAVSGDNATVNIPTGGIVSHDCTNNRIEIGYLGEGTVNVQGGTLQAINGGAILVGASGVKGTLNLTSGSMTSVGDIVVGNVAEGILNVSGGSASITGTVAQRLVVSVAGPGTVNLSGGSVDIAGPAGVNFGSTTGSTGTGILNLDGGTLFTQKISKIATAAGSSAVFNFNGGTLKARGDNAAFMTGLDTANVHNGSALIDTNGANVTIAQALVHSTLAGANAKDGGLAKSGNGTLTLGNANTYTGDTQVQAGELVLGTASLNDSATVRIASGATLKLAYGGPDIIGSLFLNGVQVLRGTYVPQGSATPGIQTPRLTGTTGSLVVLTDTFATAFDSWASTLPAGKRARQDDADGDGFTNLEEFLFGTAATSPDPSLTQFNRSGGNLIVTWKELNIDAAYQLQESSTLSETTWPVSPVVPTIPDQTGVPANYTLKQAVVPVDGSRKFIRVRGAEN
ncbi:MAG: autotransporter-associated beta strand repeat-containing protein [Luteolibacter sp.]|uniref:endo-beta-N-acetylglucosaminidase n=1 Tax=Luteolibacter sp. TaxID=1962973 RepID=UPI003264E2A5